MDKYFHQKSLSFNSVETCRITPEATFYVLAVGPKMLFNLNFLQEHVLRFRETILFKLIWIKVIKILLHFLKIILSDTQLKPLNVIALGQIKSDYINRMITNRTFLFGNHYKMTFWERYNNK